MAGHSHRRVAAILGGETTPQAAEPITGRNVGRVNTIERKAE
jgi:hypothetical protein